MKTKNHQKKRFTDLDHLWFGFRIEPIFTAAQLPKKTRLDSPKLTQKQSSRYDSLI